MFKSSPSSVGSRRVNRGEQDNGSELANNQMGDNGGVKERLRMTSKRIAFLDDWIVLRSSA